MAQSIRVEMNSRGAVAIMKSPAVMADLLRRGNAIRNAAGGQGFMVTSRVGSTRARVSVITSTDRGRRAEAQDRTLTRALDAARGR